MKVGIIELVSYTVPPEWRTQPAEAFLRRHLYSIMPQVVAVWARQLGHDVNYATYHGQSDPITLLPKDLDFVFVSAATQASALAYALAKLYRKNKSITVLGGPHARCFPKDSIRFFDIVVCGSCDRSLICDILKGHIGAGAIVSSEGQLKEFPGVEERLPEIKVASFTNGKPKGLHVFAMLASVGCPYTCNFCTEWQTPYAPLSTVQLTAQVRFIAQHYPSAIIAYHDPNFAVKFDQTLDAIEAAGPPYPRYAMNCSLSVLKDSRLERLKKTNCGFLAPGIESWFDYGDKASVGTRQGRDKLKHVIERLTRVRSFVPGMQANFIFGTDVDSGVEPVELTLEFIRRLPFLWPNINIPTPYGGTPLFDRYLQEGRILRTMPLAFYCAPYLVTTLKKYTPLEYYKHLIRIMQEATNWLPLIRRVISRNRLLVRLSHLSQSLSFRRQLREIKIIASLLENDKSFRDFHYNQSTLLPKFYQHSYKQRLGRYSELMSDSDLIPELA